MGLFGRKKKVNAREKLKEVLGNAELPSFPAIVLNALERVRQPDISLSAVGDLVSTDPGLSVRLLKTVNSAAFALRQRVQSVHHAVSILGTSQLESLLISMAVRDALPGGSVRGFESFRFWRTAARRAATARALADILHPATRSESFTASLLQDMAIPILAHRRATEYGEILEQWHGGDESLATLESGAYGWNHAQVGNWMCTEWAFPDQLAGAIAAHHGGEEEADLALPAVSLVADLREVREENGIEQLVEHAHDAYALERDRTIEVIQDSFASADEHAALMG